MKFDDLSSIEWERFETTADWIKVLNDLLGLIESADTAARRAQLADALDEFASHSVSDDLATITRLDASARKAARALRNEDITKRIRELADSSGEFQAAVKEFSAATAELKKEASLLRLEKLTTAASSLTSTISSLKNLAQVIDSEDDKKLGDAIAQAIKNAQSLRELLEKSG